VWSFNPEDRLRVASIDGVAAVDPAQVNVPQVWRALPAYRVTPASTLRVIERSRGVPVAEGNDLQLQRTAWLDFAGKGYTIVDNVSGAMRRDWRLDLSEPYGLRSARTSTGAPLLVTAGMIPGLTGVELRGATVALTAVSRMERAGGSLPATGWRTRFTSVSGRLVMAPGYRLLAAVGPDSAPGAWLERWQLLDIFVVLLTATVAWRTLGVRPAIIALIAGALTYQEIGAPAWLCNAPHPRGVCGSRRRLPACWCWSCCCGCWCPSPSDRCASPSTHSSRQSPVPGTRRPSRGSARRMGSQGRIPRRWGAQGRMA